MKAKERAKRAIASIVISALSAGMVGATISFDYDVDPVRRKRTPDFYGIIPDGSSRSAIFVCMVVNSALLLLIRGVSSALLMLVGKRYLFWYYAGDMGLYLILKMARGDFHYWIPVNGKTGIFLSVLMRVMVKTVTDHTGIVQFRTAAELGGIYFSVNLLMVIAASYAAVTLYYAETPPSLVVLPEKTSWSIVGSLSITWLVFFVLFLALMRKKYRRTFFSLETGNDWAQAFFVKGETDEIKQKTVTIKRVKWKPIAGDVKKWVNDSWEVWEEDQPDWFTDAWKSRIPDDWLTPAELRRQKVAGGGLRRGSSLGELLGGSSARERKGSAAALSRRGSATVVPTNDAKVEGGRGLPFTVVEEEPGLGVHFYAVAEEEGGERGGGGGIAVAPAADVTDEKSEAVESGGMNAK
jgi:hypothetical protein